MNNYEIKLLAIVAAGTKRKKRTVNILKVAKALSDLVEFKKSTDIVAKEVKLSHEMIREFIKLNDLVASVKSIIEKGLITSVDVGYRISKLNPSEQVILSKKVLKLKLSSGDVRSIVKYKLDNPGLNIERVIEKVLASKVKKIYVAYLPIESVILERVSLKRGEASSFIKRLFQKEIGDKNLELFDVKGNTVLVKVTKEGLILLRNKARKLRVPLVKLGNALVKESL